MANLERLMTEKRNTKTMNLDEMSPYEIITIMNKEDQKVLDAVHDALPQIGRAIEWTTESLQKNGRIIYIGAGTSGRLGILDAVECPPTFGVSYDTIVGVIAGGEGAFVKAEEGAEDDPELGKEDLKRIYLSSNDVVIGLAASGRTPYVLGALQYAKEVGCRTVAISCNTNTKISEKADCAIELLTGPEILTGSTRLKAGTAEKMVLNMISTVSMVGIGKAYQNLMVDLRQTNKKLVTRAENIVMEAVGCERDEAKKALREAGGGAKLAITKMLLNCDIETARECLTQADGKVKVAVSKRLTI
ncbi:N-acetylmuramic acid 6-phosphate etherase [Blautia liquoris]|uniref:N-acetylmuramic acid 6-phosphate etherase n=1 Tax=Blautia liquoris TaxID=2779518 RepID=A0A7M2RI32_9FIRM|nr:N-acetylmuramic acid 6-phosphate etherase [Blautia liquoris]QOV19919.1 N-acetylmuramic acid 6-phosphate etherase [Blautia liquoris]